MRIIAGEARGRKLLGPRGEEIRPPLERIRASIFSLIEGTYAGAHVLDLFAGTGSFGLEAISRGARRAIFVEKAEDSIEILRRNVRDLGFEPRAEVLRGDALRRPDLSALEPGSVAVVFLDPPFPIVERDAGEGRVMARVAEIAASKALSSAATIVLRVPSRVQPAGGPPPARDRVYGESRVLLYHPSPVGA